MKKIQIIEWNYSIITFISLRKLPTFRDTTIGFRPKWRVKQAQEFLTDDTSLRDLGSASDWSCCMENLLRPIRSTIQIWLVAHHQYGILVLVAQTSFHRETSCGVTKCWLFSQAILSAFENVWCNSVHFFLFFCQFASLTGVTQTVGFIGRIK